VSSGNICCGEAQSVAKLLRSSNVFLGKSKSATKEKRKKSGNKRGEQNRAAMRFRFEVDGIGRG
jgi:hypothetical protein